MDISEKINKCLVENRLILQSSDIDLDEAKRLGVPVYNNSGILAGYFIEDGFDSYSAYCNVSKGNFANAFRVSSVLSFLNIDKPTNVLFEYMDLVCKKYFDTDRFTIDRNIILKNIQKVKDGLYEVYPITKKYFWVKPYTSVGAEDKIVEGIMLQGKRSLVMSQYNKSKRIDTISKIENAVNLLIAEGNEENTFLTINDIEKVSGVPKKTISNIYNLFKTEIDRYNVSMFNTSIYAEFVKISNVATISSSIVKFKDELETKLTKRKVAKKSELHINTVYNLWLEDDVQEALEEYNKWVKQFKK
jgi:hypothetical protein